MLYSYQYEKEAEKLGNWEVEKLIKKACKNNFCISTPIFFAFPLSSLLAEALWASDTAPPARLHDRGVS